MARRERIPKTGTLQSRCTEEELEIVETIADKERISTASLIRKIVLEYCEEYMIQPIKETK